MRARPFPLALLLPAVVLALGGCGGGSDTGEPVEVGPSQTLPAEGASLPEWVERELDRRTGDDVSLVFSTSDYAPGANRIGFLVIRDDGELVQAPEAEVLLAREGSREPVRATAELVPLESHEHEPGTGAHDHRDATDLYVATVETPEAGRYWLVVDPAGEEIQGVGTMDVADRSATPAVGEEAIPSDTPTLDDAPAEELTTAEPPDTELLRHSVADAIRDGAPFVLVFATPKFCESRTCGPAVEVVEKVRGRFDSSGIRFIHVEIYRDNDPAKGTNRWVREWNLPTEPWVFVVDGEGTVRAKFEGAVSLAELDDAIRRHLL